MTGLLVLNSGRAAMQKIDPTSSSMSTLKKRKEKKEVQQIGGKGVSVLADHTLSLSRVLAPWQSCWCLPRQKSLSLEDEEKWLSSLPRVTLVTWWRQDQDSDFPSEPNRHSLQPRSHQEAHHSGLRVHTSRLFLCQTGWLRTLLSWCGPRNSAQTETNT